MAVEKIKIMWAVLELPAKQLRNDPPKILFFSIFLSAEYLFYVKSIAIYAPQKVDIITHSLAVYFTWIALISSSGSGGSPSGTIGDIWGGELLSNFLNSGLSSKLKLPFLPLSVFSVSTTLGFGVNSEKEMYWKLKLGYEKFTDSS